MKNLDETLLIIHINEIVIEAIIHGGDAGGPYGSNEEGLTKSLDDLIDLLKLSKECEVSVESGNPQIVYKEDFE